MDKVYAERTLRVAWERVERNHGSAGVDRLSVKAFANRADAYLAELGQALKTGTYRPLAVRRVRIPKPGRPEGRPQGIPAVKDRVVQTALKLVLEPIFEVGFAERSYGFRPNYIRTNSTTSDRIAVLGSEPQIYFYAQRRGGTRYIYMYPLMEPHKYALLMQQEMIADIEAARPRFLVFANIFYSWLPRPSSERLILDWFARFQQRYYQPVGIADMVAGQETIWRWGEECAGYQPRSRSWVAVLKRREDPPPFVDR